VRSNGQLGDWFQVVTGVQQGCILLPLVFLMVMDRVLKIALDDNKSGIQWMNDQFITNLDFADDIALLEVSWQGMAEITTIDSRERSSNCWTSN